MDLKQTATKWLPKIYFLRKYNEDLVEIYSEYSTLVDLHWHHMWLCISH